MRKGFIPFLLCFLLFSPGETFAQNIQNNNTLEQLIKKVRAAIKQNNSIEMVGISFLDPADNPRNIVKREDFQINIYSESVLNYRRPPFRRAGGTKALAGSALSGFTIQFISEKLIKKYPRHKKLIHRISLAGEFAAKGFFIYQASKMLNGPDNRTLTKYAP